MRRNRKTEKLSHYARGAERQPGRGGRKKTERLSLSASQPPRQYRLFKKRTKVMLYILLVIFTGLMMFSGYQAFINTSEVPRNRDAGRYGEILTEEEQKAWGTKEVQRGEAVFQLNLEIPVDVRSRRAEIRLVHPPYSDFICQVELTEEESGIVLYESEEMIPGTVIQYAILSETMAEGTYDAIARYTFTDGKGKVYGTYDVETVLEVKEGGSEDTIQNPYGDITETE